MAASIFMIGDSTMCDYEKDRTPRMGWGQALKEHVPLSTPVYNHALSGRSSKSFIEEGHLGLIEKNLKVGDYLLIQFGHNDQKEDSERFTSPFSSFQAYLNQYIDLASQQKAIPIMLTSIERRSFNDAGELLKTHGDYPKAMIELGRKRNVPVIDLTSLTRLWLEKFEVEESKEMYMWVKPGEFPGYPDGEKDNTHLSEKGANNIAEMVINELLVRKLMPAEMFVLSHNR
ncbi:rhamnogalacturonan acetylesterase [Salipaludibacillus sp. HK11]|uniref:rhamnogalacturonan acetylesterase n=1 Tax=Salipaludibacillus sp. HK11 TaxID=3394320 RepID=UPI0039FCFAFF